MELYDDAKPELVEKGVRKVRKNKVSEDFVNESFDTLPKPLQEALSRKGKVGKPADKKHFLGYEKEDGSVTSDVNDPDIKIFYYSGKNSIINDFSYVNHIG